MWSFRKGSNVSSTGDQTQHPVSWDKGKHFKLSLLLPYALNPLQINVCIHENTSLQRKSNHLPPNRNQPYLSLFLLFDHKYLFSDKVQTENKILRKTLSLIRQSRYSDNNSMQWPCFFFYVYIYAALETSIFFHGPRDHEKLSINIIDFCYYFCELYYSVQEMKGWGDGLAVKSACCSNCLSLRESLPTHSPELDSLHLCCFNGPGFLVRSTQMAAHSHL